MFSQSDHRRENLRSISFMQIIQKQRKLPRLRKYRKHPFNQTLEPRPQLVRLQYLSRHFDLDVKQVEDIFELGSPLVEEGDVVNLGTEAVAKGSDEVVEVGVEDDELAEDGGETCKLVERAINNQNKKDEGWG